MISIAAHNVVLNRVTVVDDEESEYAVVSLRHNDIDTIELYFKDGKTAEALFAEVLGSIRANMPAPGDEEDPGDWVAMEDAIAEGRAK